jgi:hypothetical protein
MGRIREDIYGDGIPMRNFGAREDTGIGTAMELWNGAADRLWYVEIIFEERDYDPVAEFYDIDRGNERGQFVSSYYISTLLDPSRSGGLALYGGVPAWSISGDDYYEILVPWLEYARDEALSR